MKISDIKFNRITAFEAGNYLTTFSTFINFRVDETSCGSCILCNHSSAIYCVNECNFYGNSAVITAGAVGVCGCLRVYILNSCFARNYATYGPDLYIIDSIRKLYYFELSELVFAGSQGDSHGLAIGTENESIAKNLNQSNLITLGESVWSIWSFIYNHNTIDLNFILSSQNYHENLFGHGLGSDDTINIHNFCSTNDSIKSLIQQNTGKCINFYDSIFILKNNISIGKEGEVNIVSGCYSNIWFHNDVLTYPNITAFLKRDFICQVRRYSCENNLRKFLKVLKLTMMMNLTCHH